MIWNLIPAAVMPLAGMLFVLWLISIATGRVSFIDSFWGVGFVIVAWAAADAAGGWSAIGNSARLVLVLVTLWGLRLGGYLLLRFLREGEDRRYVRLAGERTGLRRHVWSLTMVFGLQGLLILIIAAPLIGVMGDTPREIGAAGLAGAALWGVGVFFEWVGDWQLVRFRGVPDNEGKVLDTGLWAWTRHPNYFGDACLWWGLWLASGQWWAVFAPALMTFLLMKWSGKPMLEAGLRKRKPDYAAYIERTSGFFPRPPARGNRHAGP